MVGVNTQTMTQRVEHAKRRPRTWRLNAIMDGFISQWHKPREVHQAPGGGYVS